MNDPTQNNQSLIEQLETLLLLSLAGDASEEQVNELNELLRCHEHLRVEAARFLKLEAMLFREHQIRLASDNFQANHSTVASPVISAGELTRNVVVDKVSAPTKRTGRLPGSWILLIAASILGIAVLGAANLLVNSRDTPRIAQPNIALAVPANRDDAATGEADATKSVGPVYVATVTFESDAKWNPAMGLGAKVPIGELALLQGVGRIHTIRGAVLSLDARKQPVRLRFESLQSVLVDEGIVLAKANESAMGFSLKTPVANVVDIGTEFSVSVDPEGGSDVSVVDGAVTCLPANENPIEDAAMLSAGESVRFRDSSDRTGAQLDAPYDAAELRFLIDSAENASSASKLIAHEPYNYPVGRMTQATSGLGWGSPWSKRRQTNAAPSGVIRRGQFLSPPAWLAPGSPKYSVLSSAASASRTLEHPLRLSVDQDYYVSFLMHKQTVGSFGSSTAGAGLTLRDHSDRTKEIGVSIDMRNRLTLYTGDQRYRAGSTLENDLTYLIVLKLELHESSLDKLFAKVFVQDDVPEIIEPSTWDCVGIPFHLDGRLDTVTTWSGAKAIAAFDEIRVGTSWRSVVPVCK